jgi:hypothetical protein
MKTLKQILDLLGSLLKAWPLLITILGVFVSAILWIFKVGQTSVQFSIPLSLILVIVGLCMYPVLLFLRFIVVRMRKPSFLYQGLLWKPSLLFFKYPQPLCPINGCGHKIFIKMIPPPPIQVTRGLTGLRITNTYEYECVIHGRLQSVPDMPIEELQIKAKLIQQGY